MGGVNNKNGVPFHPVVVLKKKSISPSTVREKAVLFEALFWRVDESNLFEER